MKKHLIAAAVAAAIAAPAFAQNVSLYGRIDAGYSNLESKKSPTTKETTALSFSNFLTSRWGMTGSEDLGGGLKASFLVETQLAAARGDVTTQAFGDRGLYLDLAGSFGSVRVGRMDTATKGLYDAFDAGGSNNIRGNLAATLGGITGQRDVAVRYTTPNFSGISASLAVMKNEYDETGDPKRKSDDGNEVGLAYAQGPLQARAAFRSVKNANDGAVTVVKTIGNTTAYSEAEIDAAIAFKGPVDNKLRSQGLGVGYDFGVARLTGQYWDTKLSNNVDNSETKNKYYAIGVSVPLGAVTAFAQVIDGEQKKGAAKDDRDGYQLGALYGFSKRTNAYLAYGQDKVKDGAAETKTTQMAVGVVHTF